MGLFTKHKSYNFIRGVLSAICVCGLIFSQSIAVLAAKQTPEERLELHRAMPIVSNEIENWPAGPVVGAESAILMEAETGTILYEKNIHQKQYPASTTKILTTLIASEQCKMDEIVSFSYDAVFDTPRDSSHIAMDVGQELTMEQCLNAILIRSANEVSYAVAEHITDTTDWSVFAEMMNERARELGCLNSHFANPNGLPDENHYTTAYDLAMIGRAFFANEMLCNITLTRRMEFPVTDKLPLGKLEINQMAIIPGGQYAYEYLVGCKTGFTNDARYCLVSCAERDGMKLICVVMNDENPYQYEDTISLFNYGFSNFDKVNVSQTDTKYNIDNDGLFYGGNDIFGNSEPFLSLDKDDCIILPRTASFEDTESEISYSTTNENDVALITYTYHDVPIGSVRVNFAKDTAEAFSFDPQPSPAAPATTPDPASEEDSVIFVNVMRVLMVIVFLLVILVVIIIGKIFLRNYTFGGRRQNFIRRDRRRRRRGRR